MGWGGKSSKPVLTDMQKQYEAETGSIMFSNPKSQVGVDAAVVMPKKEKMKKLMVSGQRLLLAWTQGKTDLTR